MTDARVAELVERAFDYRGYVTLRRSDGSELVGFVYDRSATHLELFDEAATHRVRVPLAEVADIAFTGEDTARKSQEMWERRKGTLEPRQTSAWGEWRESGPVLLLVALDGELGSVARAFGLSRRGNLARGRFSGTEMFALAVGVGGGSRGAVVEKQPRLVVSCGFSGGLDPALAPGDLVIATAVRDETGDELAAPQSLRQQALQALRGLRCFEGELLCAREPHASYLGPALRYALSGPRSVGDLLRLARHARIAAAALEAALRRLGPMLAAAEAHP
ncbi:MAG: hypothetical protein E6J66_17765 [Deltaproteobacteria bacterium]|nr:MAG: hypothetical protein E6J66_17765 [Deltaproteobacteria bacterium]